MAGLAWELDAEPGVAKGFVRGILFGAGANAVALRFVPIVIARFTPLPYVAGLLALALLALFEGLRWAVAGALCRWLRRYLPLAPAFAIAVFAGTFVSTVFPWSAAGGVTPWPAMVQLADLVGERGVTFVMALAAGFLAQAARTRKAWPLAAAIALPVATLVYGAIRIPSIDAERAAAPTARIALVQPSIAALDRWDPMQWDGILAKLTALTETAEKQKRPELTVWPEAAYPFPLPHANRAAPIGKVAMLPYGVHGPVLVGLILREGRTAQFNSAVVVRANGTLTESQDKMTLLWFGETVPFADRWRWLRETFSRGTGLTPGERVVLQPSGAIRAAVLNCFEDTLPDAGRAMDTAGPNLLVNITNDSWFTGTEESELHLRLAALRAVELRKDLVRSVNFGPTSWVDAAGRVRARYASDIPGSLLAEPALMERERTIFSRFGDVPLAIACALAAALTWAYARRRAR
jgi:apolipoprotein N-acyltransferase